MGPNFSEDLFFLVIFERDLGARHRPLYPLEKFISEALVKAIAYRVPNLDAISGM